MSEVLIAVFSSQRAVLRDVTPALIDRIFELLVDHGVRHSQCVALFVCLFGRLFATNTGSHIALVVLNSYSSSLPALRAQDSFTIPRNQDEVADRLLNSHIDYAIRMRVRLSSVLLFPCTVFMFRATSKHYIVVCVSFRALRLLQMGADLQTVSVSIPKLWGRAFCP